MHAHRDKDVCTPSCSRTVAYRELARGHDCRLQRPVRLYSFRQKFCVTVLRRPDKLHVDKDTRNNILDFVRTELVTNGGPYHVVALHGKAVQVDATTHTEARQLFPITCNLCTRSLPCRFVLSPISAHLSFLNFTGLSAPQLRVMTFTSIPITLYSAWSARVLIVRRQRASCPLWRRL
jgi:hypothetical protein